MGSCPYCKIKINEIEIREVVVSKHYAINIADTSGMQDACHMNFTIDLAHRGVFVAQWLDHRSVESEGSIPDGDSKFFFAPRS